MGLDGLVDCIDRKLPQPNGKIEIVYLFAASSLATTIKNNRSLNYLKHRQACLKYSASLLFSLDSTVCRPRKFIDSTAAKPASNTISAKRFGLFNLDAIFRTGFSCAATGAMNYLAPLVKQHKFVCRRDISLSCRSGS